MAEKEERIRVLIAKNPCKECSVKKCTRKCMFGLLFEKAPGMTRQEAIKKMSDAIATPYFEGVFSCENEAIEEYAKAALNALLGD